MEMKEFPETGKACSSGRELISMPGVKIIPGGKGIFLTFMAFLLMGSIIALYASISQAEANFSSSLAENVAFGELNRAFGNLRQQLNIAKEGKAGAVQERLMPFDGFRQGMDWFEVRQEFPVEVRLDKAYNAISLFRIFSSRVVGNAMEVEVQNALQSSEWGGSEAEPEIAYLVLPQCLRFSAGGSYEGESDKVAKFAEGSQDDGCVSEFRPEGIMASEAAIRVKMSDFEALDCEGVFAGCPDSGNREKPLFAEIRVVLEGCSPNCSVEGFDSGGTKVVSANLNNENLNFVELEFTSNERFKLKFTGSASEAPYLMELTKTNQQSLGFAAKTIFAEPIDEIALAPGIFDYSIRNPAFGFCRATTSEGCNCGDGWCNSWESQETCPEDCGSG